MPAARYPKDPGRGYGEYFVDQERPHLGAIAERGIKIVIDRVRMPRTPGRYRTILIPRGSGHAEWLPA